MNGFDRKEALEFVINEMLTANPDYTQAKISKIVPEIMDADFEFMKEAGVIVNDEFDPDAYYDDDDAFDFIADRIFSNNDEDEEFLTELLEDYFDCFEKYMSSKNLLDWE